MKCDVCGDEANDVEAGTICGRDLSEEFKLRPSTAICGGHYRDTVSRFSYLVTRRN